LQDVTIYLNACIVAVVSQILVVQLPAPSELETHREVGRTLRSIAPMREGGRQEALRF
jgi:hypothetical protein